MDTTYGAIDDDDDLAQYYVQPQARSSQSRSHFGKQSSYSSNAASMEIVDEFMSALDENHEFNIKNELEERMYSNEFDIDIAAQPRDIYKANHIELGSKPSNNLFCLWVSLILIIIFVIGAITCIDEYIISIYGNSSESGFYLWSFGWSGSKFNPLNTILTDNLIPLTFTKRYAVDAGRFFIISSLIIFICLIFIMIILCSRCTNQVYLYILCCNIRIPQTPSLYILFSIIKHYSRISIYLYLFVILYGMLEMNFYANYICINLGGACSNFAIPHYGAASFFLIGLVINCFVTKRVILLDKGFNKKTIQYFYPDHVRKMNSRNYININLDYLKSSLHSIRIILICASVMFITFENCGMILITDWDQNTNTFSLFFQFQGLINDKGINYNDISFADNFVMICWIYYHILLPFILIFNLLTLFYFYWVIIKFKSISFCKFIILLLMFIEWILFIIINGLYYYLFNIFWNDYLKSNREKSIYYNPENEYKLFWLPDWGIFVVILIIYYQLKLIYFAFKSM